MSGLEYLIVVSWLWVCLGCGHGLGDEASVRFVGFAMISNAVYHVCPHYMVH
jgi:hypothetical protein